MQNENTIKLLPLELRNQIAAGEVVERPSSVVKELVENSIDAQAKNIHITIENGGQSQILIQDDGIGIAKEQLELAITRHATSKVSNLEELMSIQSYGFRGEALSSIASVSKFSTTSFWQGQDTQTCSAYKIEILHGRNMGISPASLHKGTIVEVRDLFENIPARLKFLKTPNTEQKRIQDSIIRIALSCPEISFNLTCGQRKTLNFTTNQSLYDRLCVIWPELITDNLKKFDSSYNGIRVHGLAAMPQSKQNKSDRMYFYVNGRAINDKSLIAGVKDAYKGHLTSREYPQLVLFVEIDPREVDVNVHPAKSEVRFRDGSAIFLAVSRALSPMLKSIDYSGYHEASKNISEQVQQIPLAQGYISQGLGLDNNALGQNNIIQKQNLWGDLNKPQILPPRINTTDELTTEYYNNNGLSEDIAGYNTPHNEIAPDNIPYSSLNDPNFVEPGADNINDFAPMDNELEKSIAQKNASENISSDQGQELGQEFSQDKRQRFNYLGQVANAYLILNDIYDNLIILDQHAVHENILYAQIQQNAYSGLGQCLILPIELNLHPAEQERFYALKDVFQNLGFQTQLENSKLKIHTIPPVLERSKAKEFVQEALVNKHDDLSALFISMACKAAIKAGQKLSPDEAKGLIAMWQDIPDNNFCPHGRPCVIKFSVNHLEKMFKRHS